MRPIICSVRQNHLSRAGLICNHSEWQNTLYLATWNLARGSWTIPPRPVVHEPRHYRL